MVEEEVEIDLGNGERETRIKRTLVTQHTAQVLSTLGDGSLGKHFSLSQVQVMIKAMLIFFLPISDVRLKKVLEEKNELLDEIRRLKLDLEEERSSSKGDRVGHQNNNHDSPHTNGPENSESAVDSSRKKPLSSSHSSILVLVLHSLITFVYFRRS